MSEVDVRDEVDVQDTANSKPDKKLAKNISKKKRNKENAGVYVSFLAKIAKEIGSKHGVTWSGKSIKAVDESILDLEERLGIMASVLCKERNKSTITPAHMAAAFRLLMPRNLALACQAEAAKAISRFQAASA